MFLAIAAERHHVGIPREFMGYWSALERPLGRPLAYKAQMQKLNKQRISLKHYGIEPTSGQISEAVAAVRGLITDECLDLLGLEIDEVSLLDIVTVDDDRALLYESEKHWRGQDELEAFGDLAEAFDTLIHDYRDRKQIWHGKSVFDSTQDMNFLSPFFRGVTDRKQEAFDEAVIESLKNLDFNLMVVGFGIDLRRYGRFKSLTPGVTHTIDGARHLSERGDGSRRLSDYEFCRDFVVSTAVHLGEFDYEFDFWADHQRELAARRMREEE